MRLSDDVRDRLDEAVDQFIAYGGVLDQSTRRYIVAWITERLLPGYLDLDGLEAGYFRHFAQALDELLADEVLREISKEQKDLAAQVVIDLLVWFRRQFGEILVQHPYEAEQDALEGWTVRPMGHVFERWEFFTKAIGGYYTRDEISVAFHQKEIDALREKNPGGHSQLSSEDHRTLERLFDDLLSQWDSKLSAKVLDFHLRKAMPALQELASQLHGKAREYKELKELLEPFHEYAGRYWDLSRDLWTDVDFNVIHRYRELLEKDDELRQLAELLGRLREAERITEEVEFSEEVRLQSQKTDPTQAHELVGVYRSNDLNRLLPSELALLADGETESLFLKRFADQSLQSHQYEHNYLSDEEGEARVTESRSRRKEQGPFIVCLDTSGSMEGLPEQVAKVLCFGIMKMAARQNRQAYLINFSTGIQTLNLLNVADQLGPLAKFLQSSFHGGTDITLALDEALRQLEEQDFEHADVLVISDFVMYQMDSEIRRRMKHRQLNRQTAFYSLVISDEANEELLGVFDRTWIYDPTEKGIVERLEGEVLRSFARF